MIEWIDRLAKEWHRLRASDRFVALALAVGLTALLLLSLLSLVPNRAGNARNQSPLIAFDVAGDRPKAAQKAEQKRAERQRQPDPPRPRDAAQPPPQARDTPRSEWPKDIILMTRRDYARSDIGSAKAAAPDAGARADAGGGSPGDSAIASRDGPNGETLYVAEWYRRPTDAELAAYRPPMTTEGWGLIACRTAPGYRVEDCRELDDFPRGSRLAGAVRQAAWQFRVRPPRIGGRELVGEWVAIRIDYRIRREREQ